MAAVFTIRRKYSASRIVIVLYNLNIGIMISPETHSGQHNVGTKGQNGTRFTYFKEAPLPFGEPEPMATHHILRGFGGCHRCHFIYA